MKIISLLNLIKGNFNSSSLLTKVEVYLFPLILLYIFYYLLENNIINKDKKKVDNQLLNKIEESRKLNTSKFEGSYVRIQKDINAFSKKAAIKLKSLNVNKNIVSIQIVSSKKKLISFIEFCENYNNFSFLTNISLKKHNESKLISASIKIDFNKYFNKSNLKKEFEINKRKNKLYLKAIVLNNININDKWLNLGDKINGYIVKKINNHNQVILEKGSESIVLRIHKYE